MKHLPNYCPIPMPDGSDCWRSPEPDGYAGICTEHMQEIAKAWVGDIVQRRRCDGCGQITFAWDRVARVMVCTECLNVIVFPETDLERHLGTRESSLPERTERPRTDVVYYIAFGDRIKIGTTANLPGRMKVLPHDQLLAIEPGNQSRERQRHSQFSRLLIPGQQEWFRADADLVAHATAVRAKFGPPMGAWRAWSTRASAA